MPKNKVSEYSPTASNNTDIGGINIAEGCAPSGINNAIRELMAQLKDMQAGTDGDTFTVGGNLTVSSTLTANSSVGTAGQALISRGAGLSPQWGTLFVTGMIMMWSGTIATIPSGWVLCDGNNSTPDLRNRFIIGANADDAGVAKTNVTGSATQTGGTKDAIVVSHTHTATVTDPGHTHTSTLNVWRGSNSGNTGAAWGGGDRQDATNVVGTSNSRVTSITVANSTEGSSGTNQNLPPYYALAFIMKT
jgi:microcystin-dependent protein